jgi:uncharacterized protein YebE (UPF0316 family)
MDTKLLIIFIVLNIVNVIIQTVKSIATIKCGKTAAAIVNAIAYGLYTVVVVYTVCDLPLWFKVVVVGGANLIGVWVVKWMEEKSRKDKLWKVEATVLRGWTADLHKALADAEIPHNYLENVGKYTLFNLYCATQAQSAKAKEIMTKYDAKYFVSETKIL